MFRPRVIPVLLLKNQGLVKSTKFSAHRYIGDPINAVRLFNDLQADELSFIDIMASKEKRSISLDFVKNVGDEANMPFSVGGGIKTIVEINEILKAGAEKVILNTVAMENPDFVHLASEEFGSSTIVVCIDIRKNIFGTTQLYSNTGIKRTHSNIVEFAHLMESKGAGEIIIQSVDRDGTMSGYDIEAIDNIAKELTIPVVALGGTSHLENIREASLKTSASAFAAGSLFVYHGTRKAVLINYPSRNELSSLFS